MMLGLRLRWLWLAASWPFRWAHHPLCERFGRDVLRFGPLRLCRSCTLLYAALAATAVLPWMLRIDAAICLLTLVGMAAIVLPFSHPPLYHRLPRAARDVLRAGAGALLGLSVALALHGWFITAAAAFLALLLVRRLYRPAYARMKRCACDGCPELGHGVCSGYAMQAEAARRYERVATELVIRSGGSPGSRGSSELRVSGTQ